MEPMAQVRCLRWAWLLVLMFLGQGVSHGAPSSSPSAAEGVLTRVISAKAKTTGSETVLTVKGNGRIPEFMWETFAEPPRIVVDLLAASRGSESRTIEVESPNIERVRIGYHADRIRLVVDVQGPSIPPFSVKRENSSLILTVSLEGRPSRPGLTEPIAAETE
ncbi:MAG: AMIN domain-containing protein, partial [Desulfobacteraceae bacterium]